MSTAKKIERTLGRSTLVDLSLDNTRIDSVEREVSTVDCSQKSRTRRYSSPRLFSASCFSFFAALTLLVTCRVSCVNAFDFNNLIKSYNSQRVLASPGKPLLRLIYLSDDLCFRNTLGSSRLVSRCQHMFQHRDRCQLPQLHFELQRQRELDQRLLRLLQR